MDYDNLLALFKSVNKDDVIDISIFDELMRVFERLNTSVNLPRYLWLSEIDITYGDFYDKYLREESKYSLDVRTLELDKELHDSCVFESFDYVDDEKNGKIKIKSKDGSLKTLIKIRGEYFGSRSKIYMTLTVISDHKKLLRLNVYCDHFSKLTGKFVIFDQK